MSKKHLLITGASGYLGSNLLTELSKNNNYKLTGFDIRNYKEAKKISPYTSPIPNSVKFIKGDLFDVNSLKDWGILVYDKNDSSTYRPITYEFDSGDAIQVSCTYYPKHPDQNNLKVSIMMREYKEYLYNDAVDAN